MRAASDAASSSLLSSWSSWLPLSLSLSLLSSSLYSGVAERVRGGEAVIIDDDDDDDAADGGNNGACCNIMLLLLLLLFMFMFMFVFMFVFILGLMELVEKKGGNVMVTT